MKFIFRKLLIVFVPAAFLLTLAVSRTWSSVMLQGFYWDVPSPAAGQKEAPWWWDNLALQAQDLAGAGFTSVWIPPVTKGASGGYSVGYDPYDDYDLGSKDQKGTIPTRYGTREQLERCVAMLRANGLEVYVDLVLNHRNGDPGDCNFQYLDAYGKAGGGRFPKGAKDFHPNVPQDPNVPGDIASFGRDVAHINSENNYMSHGLMDSVDWMTRALDVQGYRVDYVKGISCDWLYLMLSHKAMAGKFAVTEFWDGDDKAVTDYVQSCMRSRCWSFDFPLRYMLRDMCNFGGDFDMSKLHRAGLMGRDASHAVTFVDNHDTAREDAVKNKEIAYAYILTSEGYPCIFYGDYSMDKGCLGMKNVLDNLTWIHEKLADGPTRERWKDGDVFVFERTGGRHLLVGLNDNPTSDKTITAATGFKPGANLHDYTGHRPDILVDAERKVTFTIPRNDSGKGYVCYSVSGVSGSFDAKIKSVTQDYEGAKDLDIRPADNSKPVQVCRVWAAAGKPVVGRLFFDNKSWTKTTRITLGIHGPNGKQLALHSYRSATPQGTGLSVTPRQTGWHTFKIRSHNTSSANPKPSYRLRVTYTAPNTL